MPHFTAHDGTVLAHHTAGDGGGPPLVGLPGGPMQSSGYLAAPMSGGPTAHRRTVRLDPRGTGGSAVPDDPSTYRCDRQTDDVEALRTHLGAEQLDLFGHSAGANLAVRYLERHPGRVRRLVLAAPSTAAVGIEATDAQRRETALLRRGEPWFPEALAALDAIAAGRADGTSWPAVAPFLHGRWDERVRAQGAADLAARNDAAVPHFGAEGAYDPGATRAALAGFPGPVLLVAGEWDVNTPPSVVAEYARLFPDARLVVQPRTGHFPWRDDPARFAGTLDAFLA